MQQFQCPFCGLRDEREFHYEGECGKTRPNRQLTYPTKTGRDTFMLRKMQGRGRRALDASALREVFELRRDSVTMAVSEAFRCERTDHGGLGSLRAVWFNGTANGALALMAAATMASKATPWPLHCLQMASTSSGEASSTTARAGSGEAGWKAQ